MDGSRVFLLQKYCCVALTHRIKESIRIGVTLSGGQKLALAIDRNTNYLFVDVVLLKSHGILFMRPVYIEVLPPL